MEKRFLMALLDHFPDDADLVLDIDGYIEPIAAIKYDEQYNYIQLIPEDSGGPADDEDAGEEGQEGEYPAGASCDVTGRGPVVETIQDESGTYKIRDA